MTASNLSNCRATCAVAPFAKPALLARPTTLRRTLVCKAAQGSNETLRKLAGAAAAAQIALLPFAGSALAQPQFDLAVDLPNPLELAQGATGKADKEIPSNGNAAAQKDPIGDRAALLAKMNSTEGPDDAVQGGASGHPRAATGDLALGDIVDKAKDAASKGDSPLTPGEVNLPKPPSLEETKKAVEEVTSGYDTGLKKAARSGGKNISASRYGKTYGDISLGVEDVVGKAKDAASSSTKGGSPLKKADEAALSVEGGLKEAARSGGKNISATRATGDVSLGVEDVIGKAKSAASGSSKGDSPLTPGEVNLPGPAPSLEETKKAVEDVAAGGGGLKAAVASRGANISRTGDALPDGLKPGQYKPT